MTRLPDLQDQVSTAADDRRRHPRRPALQTTGKIYESGDQKHLHGHTVRMIDLSLRGTRFRSSEAFTVGRVYGLHVKGNWMNLSSRIRIVSCRAMEGGEFEVGAEFC